MPPTLFAKGVRAGDVIYRDVNKDGDLNDIGESKYDLDKLYALTILFNIKAEA